MRARTNGWPKPVVATLGAAVSEHVATKTDITTLTADLNRVRAYTH